MPMNDANGYAVFFFPQALEALGPAIKPYLQESPAGEHVLCNAIDTGGALIEMTLRGNTADGKLVVLDLMVPVSMVRMIVSSQSDGTFGFGPRLVTDGIATLAPVGPTATAPQAATTAVPAGGLQPRDAASPDASPGDGDADPEG
jgi:hypothetical protein